ncbi:MULTISPECIES: hypothetical protein [Sulfitobacter]|uniref:Uncharacterized protein n=1 Tax=Sulfitobacter profundi TaxID=2679961 RepID=A0ABW1YUU5_9RHOB|nr:hypothetical protein [Sulfitobacter indolifex]
MILTRSAASKGQEMTRHRAAAVAQVNQMIGDTRLIFITDIPGQGAIYAEKEAEAISYMALDPAPADLAPYPFIEQEMLATGMTGHECAQLFLNMAAQWRPLGAQLEGLRIGCNHKISAALSKQEVDLVLADLEAALRAYAQG